MYVINCVVRIIGFSGQEFGLVGATGHYQVAKSPDKVKLWNYTIAGSSVHFRMIFELYLRHMEHYTFLFRASAASVVISRSMGIFECATNCK